MLIKRVPLFLGISHTICIALSLRALTLICLGKLADGALLLWPFPRPAASVYLTTSCRACRITTRVPIYQSWLLSLWISYCGNVLTWNANRTISKILRFSILQAEGTKHLDIIDVLPHAKILRGCILCTFRLAQSLSQLHSFASTMPNEPQEKSGGAIASGFS